jgi:hypothetical protein
MPSRLAAYETDNGFLLQTEGFPIPTRFVCKAEIASSDSLLLCVRLEIMNETTMSWAVLLGLGAFHGLNPGKGWLFAVALGMQERRRTAVLAALLPLGLGHALAVGVAVGVAVIAGVVNSHPLASLDTCRDTDLSWRKPTVLASTPAVGKHAGKFGALSFWSFLMASAHGAGLMVRTTIPEYANRRRPLSRDGGGNHDSMSALLATIIHALGYLLVTAIIAVIVFEKVGVGI